MRRRTFTALLVGLAAVAALAGPRETRPPMAATPHIYTVKFDTTHSFDVRHYRLALRPAMTSDSLHGRQTIAAVSRTAGLDTVMLHCVRLAVDSVKLDGTAAGYRRPTDSLLVGMGGLASGQPFTLDIFYRAGNFSANGSYSRGYYWYPKGGQTLRTVGYTCSAPQDARKWMPCLDEPWDKADSGCVFEITAPDSFVTAANGVLSDTVRDGDLLTWRWEEASSIATYLMAFHVSRYSFWTDTARTSTGDTVPLLYFVWPQDSAQSCEAFANVPAMMECYTSRFGRYPFGKYAMAAVYPFVFGGMENQDMTTIIRNWIGTSDQYGIAHELSHMWFGDMVTCGTWADIWLNEGFASYCEAVYDEQATGRLPGAYMGQNFSAALSGNALIYPIYDPPMSLIYDFSMEYAKGAWVLHMLRWVMGEAAFWPMMRAYADSFAYGTAVTSDLQRIAEQHHGQGLDWFFDQWLRRPGHPRYTTVIYHRTAPDSNACRFTVKHWPSSGELYSMPVNMACSSAAGRKDTVVWLEAALSGPFHLETASPIIWARFDPDNWVLKSHNDSIPRMRAAVPGPCQISLVWNSFTADPAPPHGYIAYRGLAAGGPFARINGGIVPDTSYLDTGLVPGVRYYYTVAAVSGQDTCFQTRSSSSMSAIPTGVAGGPEETAGPRVLWLSPAGANPSREAVRLEYHLPSAGRTRLAIYNLSGQLVRTVVDGFRTAGPQAAVWNGRDGAGRKAASGGYLAVLEWGGQRRTVRVNRVF